VKILYKKDTPAGLFEPGGRSIPSLPNEGRISNGKANADAENGCETVNTPLETHSEMGLMGRI
jgi:hypothetical protein